jgi:hypothetical protein
MLAFNQGRRHFFHMFASDVSAPSSARMRFLFMDDISLSPGLFFRALSVDVWDFETKLNVIQRAQRAQSCHGVCKFFAYLKHKEPKQKSL